MEFIEDTGKTRTEPIDYSWRNQSGGGCLGTIDCKECGCIMAAKGTHCFCMGIYECPRCGHKEKGIVADSYLAKMNDDGWVVMNTLNASANLQNLTSKFATLLGNTQDLFGMELAGNQWTDGASADDSYYPKNKRLSDFSEEECIATLNHIHDWLKTGK